MQRIDIDSISDYSDCNIYIKNNLGSGYVLANSKLEGIYTKKINSGANPGEYYVSLDDKIRIIQKKQQQLNSELKKSISVDVQKARTVLDKIVEVTLSEPRTGILQNIKGTVNLIVNEYHSNPKVIEHLTQISLHDYATHLHLTNVMLFCIGYAKSCKMNDNMIKSYGLMGLMHDIGKTSIPDYILQAPRRLTFDEMEIIKQHPINSYNHLKDCGFDEMIQVTALEHHERIDGTGYPYGKKSNSLCNESKILAIIDCFEALTTWRPYKTPMSPLEALKLIQMDVREQKYDLEVFKNFAQSIVGIKTIKSSSSEPEL